MINKIKILFLGGNSSYILAEWLSEYGEEVTYTEEKVDIELVKKTNPDFIISYNYKYIIPKEIINYVCGKIINLHISYLPYNRGAYPNVWSFLNESPKGVTIHFIDEGIDTGDIIIQKEVFIDEEKETLKSSYDIFHKEIQKLFKENWEKIKNNQITPIKQRGGGKYTSNKTINYLSLLSKKKDGTLLLENLKKNIEFGDMMLKNFINLDMDEKEIIRSWRNHENVRKWMYQAHLISYEEHITFIKKLYDDNKNFYWLLKSKSEENIGVLSLNKIDFKNKNAYLGIYSNPDYKGAGSILIDCLKKISFEIAGLHTLKLEVIENNEKAINFYKKNGFKEEGRLREFVFKDNTWYDVIIMGILNKDEEEHASKN